MKRATKKQLRLNRTTLRALGERSLDGVNGGYGMDSIKLCDSLRVCSSSGPSGDVPCA